MELPGGPLFSDVSKLFKDASQAMGIDEMISANGFTLNEAMSAVEIGDSRMDSGAMIPGETDRPEFDPLTPLLPEEVCWVLDRLFACEMHWHAGNALAQTVYTCLYMPHMNAISPEYLRLQDLSRKGFNERRPVKLVSLIIRAAVMGMVKCCDFAYRELMKGNVHDGEDWHGDKSDLSLFEGTPPQRVIAFLEEAEAWLISDEAVDLPYKDELVLRIQLRKTLVRLYVLDLSRNASNVLILVTEARRLLSLIKDRTIDFIPDDSPAHAAFDPRIMRRLTSLMPLKALDPPLQEDTWNAIDALLYGWEILSRLSSCENLLAWDTTGNIYATIPFRARTRSPYTRSLAQSIFSSGTTVLNGLPFTYLIEAFYYETTLISWFRIENLLDFHSYGLSSRTVEDFRQNFIKLLLQHIWAPYHNRPRHRRHLMRTNVDWHLLYDTAVSISAKVTSGESGDLRALSRVPLAILHWRAGTIREIILQGFELQLYSSDELPFAYWYLSEILEEHITLLTSMRVGILEGSPAFTYLLFQQEYSAVLKEMAATWFIILVRKSKFDAVRRWTNFTVRYKWALRKDFQQVTAPDPFLPNYEKYLLEERNLLKRVSQEERRKRVYAELPRIQQRISQVLLVANGNPWLRICLEDFKQHLLGGLAISCSHLEFLLAATDVSLLRLELSWDFDICSWFPQFK